MYSRTSLLWTPSGPREEVSSFQRLSSILFYVAGTTGSVLIREVSLIQRSSIERFHGIIITMIILNTRDSEIATDFIIILHKLSQDHKK